MEADSGVQAEGGSAGDGEMPGRLVMDEQRDAIGSIDLKKDRSHAQEAGQQLQPPASAPTPQSAQMNGLMSHGANGALPNGVPAPAAVAPVTNGEITSAIAATSDPNSPPPLDQSWRKSEFNKPLGTMIERLGQQCYYDLNELINKMAETPTQQQPGQVNGIMPHTAEDQDAISLSKKRQILAFAQQQRERFTRALILSDWSSNMDDMAKLIDISLHQKMKRHANEQSIYKVGQYKVDMVGAKMPNPNIEGALELLATGKASWIPDLGYIPPKRLSAKQLLKTLRGMNVTLSTRLMLNDDVPTHFLDYSVANGRATFRVAEEFEVDLSVADEDPTSPWYFIDLRFLFSPTSQTLDDRLRSYLEPQVNNAMAAKGLQGCYDFLHNFVLTHKINILHSQAVELTRSKWFDCVIIEKMRRTLVVQYWSGMPGPKSWLEFGIVTGKQQSKASRRQTSASLSVRWFRKGEEVREHGLELDWAVLKLEQCIEQVIARHTSWLLTFVNERIQTLAAESNALNADLESSVTEPDDCTLSLSLPSMQRPLTVRIEPVTGQLSISPTSPVTVNAERRLNSDPSLDSARWLASLLCTAVQEGVGKAAELLGWLPVHDLVRQDNIKALLGSDVWQRSVYRPSSGWGENWAIAVTFGLSGDKWWIVQLVGVPDGNGKIIASANSISAGDVEMTRSPVSRKLLLQMERLAVGEVSFMSLSQQLQALRIPHHATSEPLLTSSDDRGDATAVPSSRVMCISFKTLMRNPRDKEWKPWASGFVRVSHHGIDSDSTSYDGKSAMVRHDLRLTLEPGKMKQLRKHLTAMHSDSIAMNETGGLALKLTTTFGIPFVDQIRTMLSGVDRLDRHVTALQKRAFECNMVSLSKLAFTYNSDPELSAQLEFSSDGTLPLRLKLQPPESNPHQRIRVMLEQALNRGGEDAFTMFTYILSFTLPLLQTFEQLEATNLTMRVLTIHTRSSTWYTLGYKEPLPILTLQIRARTKVEGTKRKVRWHIETDRTITPPLSEALQKTLKEIWRGKGEGWFGMGSGIVADTRGIGGALHHLNEAIKKVESSDETSKPAEPATGAGGSPSTQPAAPAPLAPVAKPEQQAKSQQQQPPTRQMQPASAATKRVREPDVIMLDD